MVNFISQERTGLQHISLLRKIISLKQTGIAHFQMGTEEVLKIEFFKGDFIGAITHKQGDGSVIDNLRRILTSSVLKFAWEDMPHEAKYGGIVPAIAITEAMRDLPLDFTRASIYRESFVKLAGVTMLPKPVHRYGFVDEAEYQHLYQFSLKAPSFKVADYFGHFESEELLLKQVRVVLFAFILGYLVPAAQKKIVETKKTGVAARIMSRFRAGAA